MRTAWGNLSKLCEATSCPQADWAGCVLRIAGHDFMDYDGNGGNDGCMDLNDADNTGLAACMHEGEFGISVESVWVDYCTSVSLADFIVIAAESVMTFTRENALNAASSTVDIDFKSNFMYGRTTATECSFVAHRLPNPENSCDAVEATFVTAMGLNWRQAAALMGVHTLGRAQTSNSGYDGWWSDVTNSRRFNNNYYASIVAKGWVPEKAVGGNSDKNQWMRSDVGADEATLGKEMMLNTDMCLAFSGDECTGLTMATCTSYDLNAASANSDCCTWAAPLLVESAYTTYLDGEYCGRTNVPGSSDFGLQRRICCCDNCDQGPNVPRDCGLPPELNGPAADAMIAFANSESEWIEAFIIAWGKATENGFTNLKALGS